MKPAPVIKSALALGVLLFCSASSFAMPIFVDVVPGLETLEPDWNLEEFPLQIEVESNSTIDLVKMIINLAEPSIVISHQVLLFDSLELDGALTLADYNIQKDAYLYLTSNRDAAVTEPGTLALLGLGLSGMGFSRRRKR